MSRCKGRRAARREKRGPPMRGSIWRETPASVIRNEAAFRAAPDPDRMRGRAGISRMRRIFGFVLFALVPLATLTVAVRAQSAVTPDEAATCFGFSFGEWTPPLDWRASGHERSPDSIAAPLASGGRGWAAELNEHETDGKLLIFPSWWPVGVKVELPARALARGDTVEGRATALVGNGFVTPPRAAVRAWLVRCGAAPGASTKLATDRGAPTGTWRGTSICLTRHDQCGRDSVLYRITQAVGTPDSLSLATSVIGPHGERPTGELRCRYDPFSAILACDAPAGVLRLSVRGTELGGRLTRRDGVDLRYVYVRRAHEHH